MSQAQHLGKLQKVNLLINDIYWHPQRVYIVGEGMAMPQLLGLCLGPVDYTVAEDAWGISAKTMEIFPPFELRVGPW